MAQTGITRWRGRSASGTEGGDDVQKSLELLDKVLSEFDDVDSRNLEGGHLDSSGNETLKERLTTSRGKSLEGSGSGGEDAPTVVSAAPKDDSPSLGHQSEDDGYMSMNGKTSKLALGFGQSSEEVANSEPLPPAPDAPPGELTSLDEMADYPPPPAEAERIISNLLPKVSPVNSKKSTKGGHTTRFGKSFLSSFSFGKKTENNEIDQSATTATQTTLPKTRHQRPFGWKNSANQVPSNLQAFLPAQNRYGSLPYEGAFHPSRHTSNWMQKSGPLPPRTLACALDRHREVRRMTSEELNGAVVYAENDLGDDNPANFSDDSLEESLSSASALPPTGSKRKSIAWEVPIGFESEEVYLTPGSTKVIGRRRKKSTEHSSTNSINRLRDVEEWPEPPGELVDDPSIMSSYCESNYPDVMGLPEVLPLDLTFNGTYVIRKGRKKERNCLNHCSSSFEGTSSGPKKSGFEDIKLDKRSSSTFDNIKELLKAIEDPPPNFRPADNSKLVRVASLPVIPYEKQDGGDFVDGIPLRNPKCGAFCKMNELGVTPEEAEDEPSSLENPEIVLGVQKSFASNENVNGRSEPVTEKKKCHEVETQTDLSDTEAQNDLIGSIEEQFSEITKTKTELEEVEKKIQEIVKIKTVLDKGSEINGDKNVGEDSGVEKEDVGNLEENYLDPWVKVEEKPPDEFPIDVEVHQHDFGPLPPSPVDEEDEDYEHDEEYSNVYRLTSARSSREKCGGTGGHSEPFYRCQDPPGSDPSGKYLNRPPEPLPHRVSDSFGVGVGSRGYANNHKSKNTTERRTLPSEFPGPISRRRTFQKRSSTLPQENTQTSCSLPETPIFARGCDIPRTPHRCPPDSLRLGGIQNNAYRRNGTLSNSSSCNKGVGLGGFNQAVVGAELLRLAGGPGRGWYPRHRQHRPASIEHLDRLPHSGSSSGNGFSGPWDAGSSRKPMTLPPNITPKFFHRSPRDALRRVTSLLIRGKGNNLKEKKEVLPPVTSHYGDPAEHSKQKKGFFKNFWKRSRHYSLDRQ